MKRYLIFLGSVYYPSGGWSDFAGSTDDLEVAKARVMGYVGNSCNEWGHVVDTHGEEPTIVFEPA